MPKKSILSKIYVFTILIVSFSLCVMSASLMSSYITIGSFSYATNSIKQGSFDLYAISLASNPSFSQSNEIGKSFKSLNAAGYAWKKDDLYYVLASGYLSEADATKVSQSLTSGGTNNTVIKLEFDEISINGNFNSQEKTAIVNTLSCFKNVYTDFYDISVSLDTNISNEIDTKIAIGNTKSNLIKIKNSFDTIFKEKVTNSLVILKINLEKLLEKIDELLECETNLSSEIKYHYFESLNLYKEVIEQTNNKSN